MAGIQQTSFTNPGYDYSTDIGQIERRRALAQALQQSSMSPLPTPQTPAGGFTPRVSPFEGLAKLAQGYVGKRNEDKADTQQRELNRKIQSDYQSMLARGLGQLHGTQGKTIQPDPQELQQSADQGTPQPQPKVIPGQAPDVVGAMGTFGSHPMGQQFMPIIMQELQRQRLAEALRGAGGGQGGQMAPQPSPMNPAGPNPSVMAGSGPMPMQSQPQPGTQPQAGPQLGGPAGGIPLEAWLLADPTGKSYLQHLASGGETSGRVFYDQSGKAFTVGKNGVPIYLQGITSRDKPEAVNLGGTTQFVNPYHAGGQQFQHTPTIGNTLEGARLKYETGTNPLEQAPRPTASQPAMQSVPGAPQPIVAQSSARPPQANPNARLTPKQQQELEAERPQATAAANSVVGAMSNALSTIKKIKESPGISHITGPIAGRTPNLTGTATNAQALVDTLKNQLGVQELQRMREASKTGGAVGQVTEREWPILQNQLGALQQSQTTGEFMKNLGDVEKTMQRMTANTTQAYESRYGKFTPISNKPDNDPLGLR